MTRTFYLIAAIAASVILFRVGKLMMQRNKVARKYLPVVQLIELGTWATIIFWGLNIYFSSQSFFPFLFVILVIFFTLLVVWYYVKDIVAGYLFRARHNPSKGQHLECGKIQGSIRELGLSQLTVEGISGQSFRIPYSTVVTKKLSLKSLNSTDLGETVLKLKLPENIELSHVENTIRSVLLLSFWCVTAKPISIKPDLVEENTLEISFFLIDPSYLPLAKNKLSDILNKAR